MTDIFYKGITGLIIAALLLTTSACWDYRDLEKRISVMGVGVDLIGDPKSPMYRVTIEIPNPHGGQSPEGGGENEESSDPTGDKVIVTAEGVNVSSALLALNKELERLPLWEHILSVAVAESVAREGIAEVVDAFIRSTLINARARVFVVEGPSAEDIIKYQPQLQPLSARFLRGFEKQFSELPRFARTQDVYSVDQRLQEWGVVLLPRVTFSEEGRLTAEGGGIVQNGVLIGWLDQYESEGANWWLNQIHASSVDFLCPTNADKHVTLRIHPERYRLNMKEAQGNIVADLRLRATGRIASLAGCRLDPSNISERRQLEAAAARELTNRVKLAADRAQHFNADFLRLGLHLQRTRPELWKKLDWDDVFPRVEIMISFDVDISDRGEWNRPPDFW